MDEKESAERIVAVASEQCPKCGKHTSEAEQHGLIRHADESGDGLTHDGGCDHCCECLA